MGIVVFLSFLLLTILSGVMTIYFEERSVSASWSAMFMSICCFMAAVAIGICMVA